MTAKPSARPRTVFMIVAHNNPALFGRLVARLKAPWTHVVALIDAKADQRVFEDAAKGADVTFLPDDQRVDVQWGGIGLTMAALRMMREALASHSAERVCMLSGVDYPIKPIEEIGRALSGDTEFVRVDRRLDPAGSSIHDAFVNRPYFNDLRYLNPRSSPVRPLQRAAMRALSLVPRKPLPGLPLYHGCGWWCLTRDAASWILDYFAQHPQVLSWLRHANCPDEIFIQTLLKASPYASSIAQDMTLPRPDQPGATLHGCHFIDWSDTRSSSPKLLDLDDLPALRASTALFARKIDPHRSEGLLDALDRAVDQPVS